MQQSSDRDPYPSIAIHPKYSKRFLNGYPWIYANEIIQSNESKLFVPGQLVQLTCGGKPVAIGYYNRHSLIAFRVLSRSPLEIIDSHFFKKKIQEALNVRALFYKDPYYRLIHAEGDRLPGLIIDRFNDVFVVQINTQGMAQCQAFIIESLEALFKPKTIYLKNDSSIRTLEGLPLSEPKVIGQPVEELKVLENSLEFSIDLSKGQKTGWFFDHRENRKLIAEIIQKQSLAGNVSSNLSHTKIERVIDYYCYSGGFAINAAKAGAKKVIAVDRSEAALKNASLGATLNQVKDQIEFVQAEVFQDMDQRLLSQQRFNLVILDPPAFVKSKKDLAPGLKGYEKLINKGIQLTAPQGMLLIASCSYHVKLADLNHCLMQALAKTKREARILKKLEAGPDHPVHPMLEESEYLKGLLIALD